jgi:hypothetical protein
MKNVKIVFSVRLYFSDNTYMLELTQFMHVFVTGGGTQPERINQKKRANLIPLPPVPSAPRENIPWH